LTSSPSADHLSFVLATERVTTDLQEVTKPHDVREVTLISHQFGGFFGHHARTALAALLRLYGNSLKQYLRHHTLVLVAQQMTVENRYSADDGVGEVHHQIGASFDGYLHRIQPLRM
jgi:hypothetical protein